MGFACWKYSNERIAGAVAGKPVSPAANGTPPPPAGSLQWHHNQVFASAAITYQWPEWLSLLSIDPSGRPAQDKNRQPNKNTPSGHLGRQDNGLVGPAGALARAGAGTSLVSHTTQVFFVIYLPPGNSTTQLFYCSLKVRK